MDLLLRINLTIFTITLLATCACQEQVVTEQRLPFYNSADFTPHWLDEDSTVLDNFHQIAPFAFTNQNGEEVNQGTLDGKIYVADFIFTSCPGICPKMMTNMSAVQKAFEKDNDVLLISHSVTPDIDSVKVLKRYAEKNGVQAGKWHLLTGEKSAIYRIARQSYFADEDLGMQKGVNDFLHTENFLLIDSQRRIRGIYNGVMPTEIVRLIEDIRLLKARG